MGERKQRNGKWLAQCKRYCAKIRRRDKALAKKGVLREVDCWLSDDGIPIVKLSNGDIVEDYTRAARGVRHEGMRPTRGADGYLGGICRNLV